MRAEAQAYVDQIRSALDLLRRFLDWDRALRRLDELNARVEDPTLWDDPKAAVIWEAFKPETEPRRSIRRDQIAAREAAAAPTRRRAAAVNDGADSDFLQREGGIY